MVQKEKASLWRIKHLLTRLSGDNTWIPCESVEMDNDINLFFDDERERSKDNQYGKLASKDEPDHLSIGTVRADERAQNSISEGTHALEAGSEEMSNVPALGNGLAILPARANSISAEDTPMSYAKLEAQESIPAHKDPKNAVDQDLDLPVGESMDIDQNLTAVGELDSHLEQTNGENDEEPINDQDDVPAPTRMRTRAQAQAQSDNTATSRTRSVSRDSNVEFVHPYFLPPPNSRPDRDFGLPQQEAEETRRILQLYIQKQEEVVRGAERVYNGLLRADRYRYLVIKWAKAEAHVGVNRDMSDGEDWYDKEEWGLTEDLKKGQDEEEEDAATTAKKTRTRRQ